MRSLCAGVVEQYGDEVDSIAIITPYKQQELAMKARYDREKGLHGMRSVYFGTVDGFQVTIACPPRHPVLLANMPLMNGP